VHTEKKKNAIKCHQHRENQRRSLSLHIGDGENAQTSVMAWVYLPAGTKFHIEFEREKKIFKLDGEEFRLRFASNQWKSASGRRRNSVKVSVPLETLILLVLSSRDLINEFQEVLFRNKDTKDKPDKAGAGVINNWDNTI